jgi:hypothetical protein
VHVVQLVLLYYKEREWGMMATGLKPRWVHPQNFREEDREILQAALDIAERDKTDLTGVIRTALSEYVKKSQQQSGKYSKLDEFLKDSQFVGENYSEILTPVRLKQWETEELLDFAKKIRARKEELEAELRRRRYYFRW